MERGSSTLTVAPATSASMNPLGQVTGDICGLDAGEVDLDVRLRDVLLKDGAEGAADDQITVGFPGITIRSDRGMYVQVPRAVRRYYLWIRFDPEI